MTQTIVESQQSRYQYARVYAPSDYSTSNVRYFEDEFLVVYVDHPDDPVVPLAGLKVWLHYLVYDDSVIKARERNPHDDPPGPGYNQLVKSRSYVSNKPYRVGWWQIEDNSPSFRRIWQYGDHIGDHILRFVPNNFFDATGIPSASEAITESYDRAVLNLYGSLQRRKDMNLGVAIAELKDSIGTVGRAVSTIAEVLLHLKKGRVSKAIRAIKDYGGGVTTRHRLVDRQRLNRQRRQSGDKPLSEADYASNMWLELQFGWLPIMNDIYDLMQVINGSLQSEGDGVLAFNGYGQNVVSFGSHTGNGTVDRTILGVGNFLENVSYTFTGTVECKVAINATYKVGNDLTSLLAQLGLTNPLSIVWETVPLSFVVDWFLPIGNWLESLQADAGLEMIQYTVSQKTKIDGNFNFTIEDRQAYTFLGTSYPATSRDYTIPGRAEYFERTLHVEELPDMPLPKLTFHELLEPFKVITALALMR